MVVETDGIFERQLARGEGLWVGGHLRRPLGAARRDQTATSGRGATLPRRAGAKASFRRPRGRRPVRRPCPSAVRAVTGRGAGPGDLPAPDDRRDGARGEARVRRGRALAAARATWRLRARVATPKRGCAMIAAAVTSHVGSSSSMVGVGTAWRARARRHGVRACGRYLGRVRA
jgi:hypothetical protein